MMPKRMLHFLFFLLLALPICFAASPTPFGLTALAILASVLALGIIFMLSHILQSQELEAMCKDELGQIGYTILFLALLLYVLPIVETQYLTPLGEAAAAGTGPAGSGTLLGRATATTSSLISIMEGYYSETAKHAHELGKITSTSGYCSFMGVGYSMVHCQSLGSAQGMLGQLFTSIGLAVMDLQAQSAILSIAAGYGFLLLLPVGVFLRAFRFTRGIGAVLMAIAVGFYVVFPACILLSEHIVSVFLSTHPEYNTPAASLYGTATTGATGAMQCDPVGVSASGRHTFSSTNVINYTNELEKQEVAGAILFQTIIRCVLMTTFNLLVTLTFIRELAGLLGTQIDVTSLVKIS